jgi:molecular chaperone Hsp33
MLKSFSPEDRRDMRADDGSIEVTCDFCSTRYAFGDEEVTALDAEANAESAAG